MCCRVHLWTVILLYLLLWSAVVSVWCSLSISTSYRGALLFLYAVWWDGQKLIRFLYSGGHMMEYCLLCCVFSCCVVLSLLSALEVCEVPGQMGDIPPGGLHFCRKVVCPYGVDVFHFHDTDKIWNYRTTAAIILLNHKYFHLGSFLHHIQEIVLLQFLFLYSWNMRVHPFLCL